ncbi:MAG: shikimate dehydrogenase [Candidatus Latescibacterota bacterium]|nr:shikimate dehydrogenase [Candidatus Latescibacterota bacterium]
MIYGSTRVVGVIGNPVEHTASPAMHNAAIKEMGLDYVYVAFNVGHAELSEAIEGIRALNIAGTNVTVPHKKAVMAYLDDVSPEAKAIGAVNTIVNKDGKLIGHNTDAFGFTKSICLEGGLEKWPSIVVLLGAGGAARAILYALLQRSEIERIHIINRTMARSELLANEMDQKGRVSTGPLLDGEWDEVGLLINSTSVGLYPDVTSSPLQDVSVLRPDMLVVDIIYKPLRTQLMLQAEECGATAINGLGMLIWQGVQSFELWTGVTPRSEIMISAALENMK